jgi:hypothetical protein
LVFISPLPKETSHTWQSMKAHYKDVIQRMPGVQVCPSLLCL